jgi:hypothetical protein
LRGNRIDGAGLTAGIAAASGVRNLFLENNVFAGCSEEVVADVDSFAKTEPLIETGFGDHPEKFFRHLPNL